MLKIVAEFLAFKDWSRQRNRTVFNSRFLPEKRDIVVAVRFDPRVSSNIYSNLIPLSFGCSNNNICVVDLMGISIIFC